jgi:predicted HD phosphohydrolase
VNRVKRHSLILSGGVVTEEEAVQYFKHKGES